MVSRVVDVSARRTKEAARASAEAETLSTLAGSVLRGRSALPDLLDQVRMTFNVSSATLLERGAAVNAGEPTVEDDANGDGVDRHSWHVVASAGADPCLRPEDGDTELPVGQDLALVLRGRPLAATDRRVLGAFAAQTAVALRQLRLGEAAAAAAPLAAADRTRTALLAAVSHDLRSPLSSAKAAVTSLRSSDIEWAEAERQELLATADESIDRLIRLVENLLGVCRLNAGVISVVVQPVALDEIVPLALDDLGSKGRSVKLQVPDALPPVLADPALLERVIANLTANAIRYSPADRPPLITASALAVRIELRVIDRGPGIPEQDWKKVFAPFQRLGDTDNSTGIGLGLALSRGLTESMGGSLVPEATPGGGLTMVIRLPFGPMPASTPAPDVHERRPGGLPPGVAHWIEELPATGQTRLDDRP